MTTNQTAPAYLRKRGLQVLSKWREGVTGKVVVPVGYFCDHSRGANATPLGMHKGFLRKEVIQPQVPLRLPCYDLVPIRSFAFDADAALGAPSFRGLTGGVYKAQEHIHRGVADPRLLAIPASCGRVAAHNLN